MPRKESKDGLIFGLLGIGLIVGLAFATTYVFKATSESKRDKKERITEDAVAKLPTEIENAKKMGLPLTIADLKKQFPDPPKEENAATHYLAALKKLGDIRERKNIESISDRRLLGRLMENEREVYEGLDGRLSIYDEVFPEIDKGVVKPSFRLELNWNEGIQMSNRDMQQISDLVRLYLLKAFSAADKENHEVAAKSLEKARIIAQHIASEPTERGMLISQRAFTNLQRTAMAIVSNSKQQSLPIELYQAVIDRVTLPSPVPALKGELVKTIVAVDSVKQIVNGTDVAVSNRQLEKANSSKYAEASRSRSIQFYRTILEIIESDQPPIEKTKMFDQIDKEGLFSTVLVGEIEKDEPAVRVSMFAHNLYNISFLACTKAYLSAMKSYKTNKKLPTSIAEFAGSITDPVSGTPLNYKADAAGFFIWAVGTDGDDDSGLRGEMFEHDVVHQFDIQKGYVRSFD